MDFCFLERTGRTRKKGDGHARARALKTTRSYCKEKKKKNTPKIELLCMAEPRDASEVQKGDRVYFKECGFLEL